MISNNSIIPTNYIGLCIGQSVYTYMIFLICYISQIIQIHKTQNYLCLVGSSDVL